MLLTIEEALLQADGENEQYIYAYRTDDETPLYVGRSQQPFERLHQHMGTGMYHDLPDAVGRCILENMPDSLKWTVEVRPLKEFVPKRYAQLMECDLGFALLPDLCEEVERDIIAGMNPCLNTKYCTERRDLPDKYDKHPIANAGIKQSL